MRRPQLTRRTPLVMATHYCTECRTALSVGARFCGNCGLEAVANSDRPAGRSSDPVVNNQACPQCGQADRVAKVSGVVAAEYRREEHRWRDSDSNQRSRTVISSTPLASKLNLPEPVKQGSDLSTVGCATVVVLFVTFVMSGLAAGASETLFGLDYRSHDQTWRLFFFSAVAVEIIIVIVSYVVQRPRIRRIRRDAVVEARMWSTRKPGWDKLYYCG